MKNNLTALLLLTLLAGNLCAAGNSLNVLFIAVDDMNADCFDNPQVVTPNFDRLAARGVRFNNAYCQQPLCGPSRASIMTGLRPDTIDCHTLNDNFRNTLPDTVTLGQFFIQQGYYVGRVGKIYHYGNPSQIGTNGHDDEATWQERFNPAGMDKTQEYNIIRYPGGHKGEKGKPANLGISMAWWDPVSRDEEHTDGMVASRAIEMIERNSRSTIPGQEPKPFFVAAGFFNPHCPYVAPKKYFDLYPLASIILPDLEEAKRDLEDVPPMAIQRDSGNKWPYWLGEKITIEEARRCKQAYYACISFVDAQVGRLLDALEEHDLVDSTLIVLWSDHGYFVGEKGLWYKRKNFERSLRSPLVIAGPGINAAGKVCRQPVELLDMYPTIVDQAGYAVPGVLEGRSLRPLLDDPSAAWDKPAISQVVHQRDKAFGYSIRTPRWRYTEWVNGTAGRELYDHDNDPEEVTNRASHPEYADVVEKLRAQLRPFTGQK